MNERLSDVTLMSDLMRLRDRSDIPPSPRPADRFFSPLPLAFFPSPPPIFMSNLFVGGSREGGKLVIPGVVFLIVLMGYVDDGVVNCVGSGGMG